MKHLVTALFLAVAGWLPAGEKDPLKNPAAATAKAPDVFFVEMKTTKGSFVLKLQRAWAPIGVDRFYNFVQMGYFTDIAFYRVVPGFVAQFGFHPDPAVNRAWDKAFLNDDPVKISNARSTIVFATRGPRSRTNQFFINFKHNFNLDRMGFAPLGQVVRGMDVVEKLYAGYGEGPPRGQGPDQNKMLLDGLAYLEANFPELDYILSAEITDDPAADPPKPDGDQKPQ